MKRIAIDLQGTQRIALGAHGGGEYVRSLMDRIEQRDLTQHFIALTSRDGKENNYIQRAIELGIDIVTVGHARHLPDVLQSRSVSTFFSPLPYQLRELDDISTRTVVTIHGARSVELPTDRHEWRYSSPGKWPVVLGKQMFSRHYVEWRKGQLNALVQSADVVVVPSEHTRNCLLSLFGADIERKLRVFYSPETQVMSAIADSSVLSEFNLTSGGYLFLVSGGRFEKNIVRALEAITILDEHGFLSNVEIVVTGGGPRYLPQRFQRRIRFLPYVEVGKLAALYEHARLLIYPTLNEGFGYPVFESLAHGTPVAASGLCSLPELGGAAIEYFDPRNVYDIASRILGLLRRTDGSHFSAVRDECLVRVRDRQKRDLDLLIDLLCQS